MHVKIISIFPDLFSGFIDNSLISKALEKNLIKIETINLRDYSLPPHNRVDDEIYGGGAGMLFKPEPLAKAIQSAKENFDATVILMTPSGEVFNQSKALTFSKEENLIIVCARYEGIDQRIIDLYIDHEISIGDYILMGGEIPSMVLIESITRLIPGVLGNSESIIHESFSDNLLEAPQYTRPEEFQGLNVPKVLLSGDHQEIAKWRDEKSLEKTKKIRPDLLKK
ncbi:UNVERIFIED_CONTAM: hypothetical protein GTU68_051091 [Idotea baltica]|nr:hypothetical protein [Idotea baltica]